jgi:hypothetical protein
MKKAAVRCEKAESHLAGIAVSCEKSGCLLRNVCNALNCRGHVDIFKLIAKYYFVHLFSM